MNSLVVLFSVMVLAAAKPSVPGIISYAVPAVATAPAAVSHQSRIDVKSSPAIVKTDIIAPVARTVLAPVAYNAPLAIAPAAVSHQSRIDVKSSPAIVKTDIIAPVARTVLAPVAYNAPLAIAPAAVSTQSRIDVKSSPAIISSFAGAPLAYSAPLAYRAPLAYSAPLAYTSPLTATYTSSFYAPGLTSAIAPIELKSASIASEAESAPASEISEDSSLPVAPTETPEVAAARAAHLEAKAFEESHQMHKRSVGIITSAPVISSYAAAIPAGFYKSPIARIAPIAVSAPVLTGAYGIHPY